MCADQAEEGRIEPNLQRSFWKKYLDLYPGMQALTTPDEARMTGKYVVRTVSTLLNHVSLDELARSTVMEFGCGTGRLARLVAPLCGKLICVDIADEMLRQARETLAGVPNVEFVLTDGQGLDFEDDSIDFTYSYAAILYINKETEFWRTLDLVDRVSKSFALHLHSQPNEDPDPDKSIEALDNGVLHEVEGYRPTMETLAEHYPDESHWVEYHEPDVRGVDPFFYKGVRPRGKLLRSLRLLYRNRALPGIAAKRPAS